MKAILKELEPMESNKERIDFLGKQNPCLCMFVLKEKGMTGKLEGYKKSLYKLKNSWF